MNQSSDGETEYAKQQKEISQLRDELVALETTCSQLNEEIADKQQALIKGKEERDKLRYRKRPPENSAGVELHRRLKR